MSIEANKRVARHYFEELINGQRLDLIDEVIAPDGIDETRAFSGGSGDREDFRHHLQWLWGAVKDLRITVTDLIAEGDRVVVYWRIEGIHRDTMFGVAGTGKPFTGIAISTLTIRDGKVVRYSVLPDRLGMIRQLGADH